MAGKVVVASIMCLCSSVLMAQGRIEVVIKNFKEERGTVRVGLFNNEKDFLKNAVEGKVVKVSGPEVTVIFDDLKPGEYAISVIHDANENEKLDTNFLGIPREGFAFGNDATGTFGPPSFDKAKVKVDGNDLRQEISLKYL